MTFKDVYKFPLKVDEYCPIITWTADKQRAFDWLIKATLEQKQQLVDVINGTNSDEKFKHQFYRDGIHIYSKAPELKKVPILRIEDGTFNRYWRITFTSRRSNSNSR